MRARISSSLARSKDAVMSVRMPIIGKHFSEFLFDALDIIFDAVCYSYRYFLKECEGGYSHFIYNPTLSKSGTESANFDFGVC